MSRSSSWNGKLRTKPKNSKQVFCIEDYNILKELIDKKETIQLHTGGKRYSGGTSGSGHSWTLNGIKKYEEIRKKLVSEIETYKGVYFSCKKDKIQQNSFTEILNSEESEDLESMLLDGEMNIEDILVSGQFTAV